MLMMWRIGLGPALNVWPEGFGRFMVLTTTGRRSGQPRRTPLNYAEIDGDIYCVAGFGGISDWYRNLQAYPQVEIWLSQGWWVGEAEDVSDLADRLNRLRTVLRGSGFVAPLVGVDPHRLSDAELAAATTNYRLVRIRPIAERRGAGGPGEEAWIWPQAALALLVFLALSKREV
ncbi:MAG: nitroreductase family deazaflavin-dependent oxidoreductase [Oscillochloris sp.]|nr:nitroreductase family deazaflavin-dependent oxidoreductase [Oscillochloris sp.]